MPRYIVEVVESSSEQKEIYLSETFEVTVETESESEKEEIWASLKEYALFAYEQETERENTIKTQASNMQAAFSFVTAAVVASMPFIYEQKGVLSDSFVFFTYSLILILLVLSLLFATFALKLLPQDACTEISEQKQYFEENYENLTARASRLEYSVSVLDKLHATKRKSIEYRIKWLNASRVAFIATLAVCAIRYLEAFVSIAWM